MKEQDLKKIGLSPLSMKTKKGVCSQEIYGEIWYQVL